ncbi:hypothetical protein BDV93DRAFT_516266 [Ceratobasidium sp. AG-I]|nr:hypothetical protein BDV93DRAFT_516266 [Ceratobasidium sp. AG-I]
MSYQAQFVNVNTEYDQPTSISVRFSLFEASISPTEFTIVMSVGLGRREEIAAGQVVGDEEDPGDEENSPDNDGPPNEHAGPNHAAMDIDHAGPGDAAVDLNGAAEAGVLAQDINQVDARAFEGVAPHAGRRNVRPYVGEHVGLAT